MHDNRLRRTHDYLFADQRLAKMLKLVDKPGELALSLYQLDWDADCGNELEDYRVSSSTYLQDGFFFKSRERELCVGGSRASVDWVGGSKLLEDVFHGRAELMVRELSSKHYHKGDKESKHMKISPGTHWRSYTSTSL